MVQTLSTNVTNDIYLGADGNLAVSSQLQAVMDACATASKAQLGEMILAQEQGMPNFQTIWKGAPNYALFQSYLRNTLLSVTEVLEVKSIKITASNNVLNYTATIETKYGTAVLNG